VQIWFTIEWFLAKVWRAKKMLKYLFGALVIAVVGSVAVLTFWRIPAPSKPVEVVIPNDHFKL